MFLNKLKSLFNIVNKVILRLNYLIVNLNKVLVQIRELFCRCKSNLNIHKKGGIIIMTTLGLQWLQHKEAKRHNAASEKIAVDDRTSRENIAVGDRASREKISHLDRASRESIASLDRKSKESIASQDRVSRESIAQAQRDIDLAITKLNNLSREQIANLDRESREFIEAQKRKLEEYKTNLSASGRYVATVEGLTNLGLENDVIASILAGVDSTFGVLGQLLGGNFRLP